MENTNVLSLEERTFLAHFLGYKYSSEENAWVKEKGIVEGSDLIGERRVLCRSLNDSGWNSEKWLYELVNSISSDVRLLEVENRGGATVNYGAKIYLYDQVDTSNSSDIGMNLEDTEKLILKELVEAGNGRLIVNKVRVVEPSDSFEGDFITAKRDMKSYSIVAVQIFPIKNFDIQVSKEGELYKKALEKNHVLSESRGHISLFTMDYGRARNYSTQIYGDSMINRHVQFLKTLQSFLLEGIYDRFDFSGHKLKTL